MNTEKMLEQKWIVTVFLLIVPTVLRCFDLLTEGGLTRSGCSWRAATSPPT